MAEPEPNICPGCGGQNPPDAVFCVNAPCHKALGEFRYVQEEMQDQLHWHEKLANRAAAFIGRPHFIVIHTLWFLGWILINLGLFQFLRRFDESPFGLLASLLAIEMVFITGFLLINGNRQNAYADKRAELDYEVNVRCYRNMQQLTEAIHDMQERLVRLEEAVSKQAGS